MTITEFIEKALVDAWNAALDAALEKLVEQEGVSPWKNAGIREARSVLFDLKKEG